MVQKERLDICKECPNSSTGNEIKSWSYCKECLCNLNAKSACMSCACPLDKWKALLTQEERVELETKLKEQEGEQNAKGDEKGDEEK